jgi:hypothetical protein
MGRSTGGSGLRKPLQIMRRIGRDGGLIVWQDEESPEGGEWELVVEFTPVRDRLYPSRLELRAGALEEGIPEGGITARLLHAIKLGQVVDEFRQEYVGDIATQELLFGRTGRPRFEVPPRANRPGPRGLGEDSYQNVARLYLWALQRQPRRPIEAMLPSFPGLTKANVRDRVARARGKGYLVSAGRGRPGGQPGPKLIAALEARGIGATPASAEDRTARRHRTTPGKHDPSAGRRRTP